MPKVAKVEFEGTGKVVRSERGRTMGAVEFELHYRDDGDAFYFRAEEVKEKLGIDLKRGYYSIPAIFRECQTRKDACDVMGRLFDSSGEEKRHIALDIKVSVDSLLEFSSEKKMTDLAKSIIN